MITTPTVFILGAGASAHAGFPTGATLRDEILEELRVYNPVKPHVGVFEPVLVTNFRRDFLESHEPSIDAFLETRRDYLRIAKYCIAQRLIQRENRALLFESAGESWYQHVVNAMRAPSLEAFGENRVSFVTFNYDRSLEEYLMTVLCRRYNKHEDHMGNVLARIPIIHVHGKLGGLPWEGSRITRRYRQETAKQVIGDVAESLKIVHDEILQETTDAINKVLSAAQRVYYLGLSYHPLNMKKLGATPGFHSTKKQRYGTRYGLTLREAGRIEKLYGLQLMLANPKGDSAVLPWLREFVDLED